MPLRTGSFKRSTRWRRRRDVVFAEPLRYADLDRLADADVKDARRSSPGG